MAGYKAQLLLSQSDAERLAALFAETLDPPPAACTTRTQDGWLLELYFDEPPSVSELRAIALDHVAEGAIDRLAVEPLPDEDWVAVTQRGLHPIEAGRFFIHGSHDRGRAAGRACRIEIDAGQAFGTAHHGTTRGCLMMLDRLAKRRFYPRMLDLGTGSGVLAIAAAKSLSRDILATDIDPVAVRVAGENCIRNHAAHRVRTIVAAGADHPRIQACRPFHLITANILAAPLIKLAPALRGILARGGDLILSGLLDTQAREVTARYHAQGFLLSSRLYLEGWATLHLRG
jgi:ribosomal protein L11 methyltransferase